MITESGESGSSPACKRPLLGAVLRSATKNIAAQREECTSVVAPERDVGRMEVDKDTERTDSEHAEETKHSYSRRQPRRFVHKKSISHGLADCATAEWLKEHFHSKPGSLVPKGFLCVRYEEFCNATERKPMNNATLGRFIRGVFPKLETRRLGARQQSRYFYNNLGIRPTSAYAALIRKEPRPLNIRRHPTSNPLARQCSRSISPAPADASCEPNKPTQTIFSSKVPPYLPGFKQRRLAYAHLNNTDGDENMEDVLKRFDEEGCSYLLTTAALNKEKIKLLFHGDLLDTTIWPRRFPKTEAAPLGITEGDVIQFFSSFRAHIGVLGGLLLTYNIFLIPATMENFWVERPSSVQFPPAFNYENRDKLLQWSKIQDFVDECYLYLYENVMSVFLPEYLTPLDEHVWGILFCVALRFPSCMEKTTLRLPSRLRSQLLSGVHSFCQCLRDVLNANHDASYVALLAMDACSVAYLTSAITEVLQTSFLEDCAMLVEHEMVADFRQAMLIFTEMTYQSDAVNNWAAWMKNYVISRLVEKEQLEKASVLNAFVRDWTVFLTALENSLGHFKGDSHIKAGFFAFCHSLLAMTVRDVERSITNESCLAVYLKLRERFAATATTEVTNSESEAQEWWPDFPPPVSDVPVDLHNEDFFRTFPDLSGIVYDVIPSVSPETSRISSRPGKGRNRWLQDRD